MITNRRVRNALFLLLLGVGGWFLGRAAQAVTTQDEPLAPRRAESEVSAAPNHNELSVGAPPLQSPPPGAPSDPRWKRAPDEWQGMLPLRLEPLRVQLVVRRWRDGLRPPARGRDSPCAKGRAFASETRSAHHLRPAERDSNLDWPSIRAVALGLRGLGVCQSGRTRRSVNLATLATASPSPWHTSASSVARLRDDLRASSQTTRGHGHCSTLVKRRQTARRSARVRREQSKEPSGRTRCARNQSAEARVQTWQPRVHAPDHAAARCGLYAEPRR